VISDSEEGRAKSVVIGCNRGDCGNLRKVSKKVKYEIIVFTTACQPSNILGCLF
jgi:hypothetical protein